MMFVFHGGNLYRAEKRFNLKKEDFIDFSVNLNPVPLSSEIRKILKKEIINLQSYYPDTVSYNLRSEISAQYKIPANNILITAGSIQGIYLFAKNIVKDMAAILEPTFTEYRRALRHTFVLHIEKKLGSKAITTILKKNKNISAIFICNPNNPDGKLYRPEDINILLKYCEENGIYLFIDEVFMDFIDNEDRYSMIERIKKHKYLVIVRSFTKYSGLPGLRIGFIAADTKIIQRLRKEQTPWSVGDLEQRLAMLLLKDKLFKNRTLKKIKQYKKSFLKRINKISGLEVMESDTHFFLIRIKKKITSEQMYSMLGKRGILVRVCSDYYGLDNSYIRVGLKGMKENKILINNIEEVLK